MDGYSPRSTSSIGFSLILIGPPLKGKLLNWELRGFENVTLLLLNVVVTGFMGLLYGKLYWLRVLVTGLLNVGLLKEVCWRAEGLVDDSGLAKAVLDIELWV